MESKDTGHYHAEVWNHQDMMEIYLKGPMMSYSPWWETRWVIPFNYFREFGEILEFLKNEFDKQKLIIDKEDEKP